MTTTIIWQYAHFNELSGKQIYAILQARCEVFAVEQNCAYLDMDDRDFRAIHIIAWTENQKVAAYLRLLPPNVYYPEPSLGRVLTTQVLRGRGIGRQLMVEGLKHTHIHYPMQPIRINAQSYLADFYRSFGFEAVSGEYMEYGIPHIEMLKAGAVHT